MRHRVVFFVLVAILSLPSFVLAQAPPLTLENFEGGIRPSGQRTGNPLFDNLWTIASNAPDGGVGTFGTDGTAPHTGLLNGRAVMTPASGYSICPRGCMYVYFYDNDGTNWHWARDLILSGGSWRLNTYNRVIFWYRAAPGSDWDPDPSKHNIELGTYVRCQTCDPATHSAGGSHYYHHYNIPYTGEWHQIIWDMHPTHQVGGDPNVDLGYLPYPTTTGTGFNYFDAETTFYFEQLFGTIAYNAPYGFDDFQFVQDPYEAAGYEDMTNIFSLNGVYVPRTGRLELGWNTPQNQVKTYGIRYKFSDFYGGVQSAADLAAAWASGTDAPRGQNLPGPASGYNQMVYDNSQWAAIVAGHPKVYIAIKENGSTKFRQIVIPTGPPTSVVPSSPSGVTVQ